MANVLGETIGAIQSILGFDGTAFRSLKIDASGELQIDVVGSALPSGASTGAKQDTLYDALTKRRLDYAKDPVRLQLDTTQSSGNITHTFGPVPADEIWVIEYVLSVMKSGSMTGLYFRVLANATGYDIRAVTPPVVNVEYASPIKITVFPGESYETYAYQVGTTTRLKTVCHGYKVYA